VAVPVVSGEVVPFLPLEYSRSRIVALGHTEAQVTQTSPVTPPRADTPGSQSEGRRIAAGGLSLLAAIAALSGATIWLTGGATFQLLGFTVRATTSDRSWLLAALALSSRLVVGGRRLIPAELAVFAHRPRPAVVAATLAILCTLVGCYTDYGVASGADSHGYVSQADLWLHGHLVQTPEWLKTAPWPNAPWTSSPIGYRPAAAPIRAYVPIYPPGLPLLLAVAKAVAGQCAIAWVVPLCGGALVWLTYLIGRRLASPAVGATAAWIMATSPVVIFMLGVPMSDVPAGAAWALAAYGCFEESGLGVAIGGLGAALAILIRPQLTPLALVLAIQVLFGGTDRAWARRVGLCARFSAGTLLGVLAIALFNQRVYGSPVISGYGSLTVLFSPSYLLTNVRLYGGWLIRSHTPLLLAGIVALAVPASWFGKRHRLEGRVTLLGLLLVVTCLYFFYEPWNAWWYLRFFLPCWPALAVGSAWLLTNRLTPRYGLVAVALVVAVGLRNLTFVRNENIFRNRRADLRYVEAARAVQKLTEPDSVILSMQQSGGIHYYAQRDILRFDQVDPAWLDRVVAWFEARHRHVYILLDEWEVPGFRQKFGATETGGLTSRQLLYVQYIVNITTLYDTRPRQDWRVVKVSVPDASLGRCNVPGLLSAVLSGR